MAAGFWLPLYHRLPPWLQDAAAAVRGWQLEGWRYGRGDRAAGGRGAWSAKAGRRNSGSAGGRSAWRGCWTGRRGKVPYYRAMWAERRVRGGRLRVGSGSRTGRYSKRKRCGASRKRFVAEDCDRAPGWSKTHTSGTSGTPLKLWQSRKTLRAWYALFEARWRRWHGVSRRDRWAILGGQLVVLAARRQPPFWVRNWPMRQLYLVELSSRAGADRGVRGGAAAVPSRVSVGVQLGAVCAGPGVAAGWA
jgi:phenylacetate-CoA ligase